MLSWVESELESYNVAFPLRLSDSQVNTNKQKQSSDDRNRIRKTQPNNLIFIIIHITLIDYNYKTIVIIIIIIAIMANKPRITTSILRSLLSLVFVILLKGYASHVFSGRFSMMRWQQSNFDHQECSIFESFVFQTNARVIYAEDYYVYNNNHIVSRHSQSFIDMFPKCALLAWILWNRRLAEFCLDDPFVKYFIS